MSHSHDHHSHAHETQGLLSPFLAKRRYQVSSKYINSRDIVLDLGCGVGGFRDYLKPEAGYYGIDAEENWGSDKSNFLFKVKIGESLPDELKDKKFTVVTALAIIEHLSEPGTLLIDASKVLKKGGLLIVTTPHPLGRRVHDSGSKIGIFSSHASDEHEDFLDEKDLRKIANQNGYETIHYKRFLLGMNQVAVYRKK